VRKVHVPGRVCVSSPGNSQRAVTHSPCEGFIPEHLLAPCAIVKFSREVLIGVRIEINIKPLHEIFAGNSGAVVSRIWRELKEAERVKPQTGFREDPELRRADLRDDIHEDNPEDHREVDHEEKGSAVSDRRHAKRRDHQFPLLVYGSDAEKQPFHEETETLDISETGCAVLLETNVVRGQRLYLANKVNQAEVAARVVHIDPRVRGKARIGIEFLRSTPEFWLTD
jgi:hypothetical protein